MNINFKNKQYKNQKKNIKILIKNILKTTGK